MVLRYGELIARGPAKLVTGLLMKPPGDTRDVFVSYRVWLKVVTLSKGKDGLEIELELCNSKS